MLKSKWKPGLNILDLSVLNLSCQLLILLCTANITLAANMMHSFAL